MKAVTAPDYGPPESFMLSDLPAPEAGPGQILVRITAASINPGDIVIPSGAYRAQTPLTFPHVPGNDFAGTVTAVAPDVTTYAPGDEIFGHAVPRALRALAGDKPSMTTGALAEYAVFEAGTPFITHRPADLSPVDAAALPTVGLTARALMATAQPRAGESVLVIGATGGVGTTILPLLADSSARVVATGHPSDEKLLRTLGADQVIGYDDPYPDRMDLALNLVLPTDQLGRAADAIRPGGRLFTITFPPPRTDMIGRDDIRFELVLDLNGEFGGMAEVAALTPTIAATYPLDQAVQALTDFAHHHTVGKLVVTIP
ncbi:NADP-dependent oxidoreductase [Actinoplanes bogorensis]|uniref:NADP-dependent oxidoreductase n=1 Tax=Paractinoplanes bogorensis TaxID=1610840 RepID=A0ABS5Z6R5_9ACTN|nr:NADP-dependent oxidoreductase [Actinoplanes bogorensis]MBU2670170.1 NADP-dependent oxidoreductase [Actinoplanes bogorensis]